MSAGSTSSGQENSDEISPGEYVLKKLFSEFVLAGQQKLDFISQQTLVGGWRILTNTASILTYQEFSLTKVQKGEDAQFDQVSL